MAKYVTPQTNVSTKANMDVREVTAAKSVHDVLAVISYPQQKLASAFFASRDRREFVV
jgi:hypothetical protein